MAEASEFSHFFKTNLANWSDRARVHRTDTTGMYDIEGFLRGEDTLCGIEADEIGDVVGRSIVHLQCHFGLDTLSLARRGASVTGLDFSPVAIAEARRLAGVTGLIADFVEGNVYDAPSLIEGRFDMVYVTWGAINWLPDIKGWAEVITHILKPGGVLYLAEGHPFASVFEQDGERIVPAYDWRTPRQAPLEFDEEQSYAGTENLEDTKSYEWIHPVGDVLNALIGAGLRITAFNEHEELPWKLFPMMVPAGRQLFRMPDGMARFPLSFSLKAEKSP